MPRRPRRHRKDRTETAVAEIDELQEQVVGVLGRNHRRTPRRHPAATATGGHRLPPPVMTGRGNGEEMHPCRDPVFGRQLRKDAARDHVAVDSAHSAGEPTPVSEIDHGVDGGGPAAVHGRACRNKTFHRIGDIVERALTERIRRKRPAAPLRSPEVGRGNTSEAVFEHPVAEVPSGQRVEIDVERVGGAFVEFGNPDAEPLPQESLGGMHKVCDEVGEVDIDLLLGWSEEEMREHRGHVLCGRVLRRARTCERRLVETERRVGQEVPGVEWLQWMVTDHRIHIAACDTDHRGHHVAHFTERNRRRPRRTGDRIGTGVEQQHLLSRRHDRIEQQLPIFTSRVAFADTGVLGEHVVAVDVGAAGKDVVVEAEENHHPMRHRAHRHHGADRELTGAEVRPCGAARQLSGEHRPHIGQS